MITQPTSQPIEQLSAADREVLEFARLRWRYAGTKETAIRDRFGISPSRFHQRLNAIIDQPAAELYDSQLVRALRDRRANLRTARSQGMKAVSGR